MVAVAEPPLTILVTGSKGFVGTHLVERLARLTFRVLRLDEKFTEVSQDHLSVDEVAQCTPLAMRLDAIDSKIDCVIHLAGRNKLGLLARLLPTSANQLQEANVLYPVSLYEWCIENQVKNFIFFSSAYTSDEVCRRQTPYVWSKRKAETMLEQVFYDSKKSTQLTIVKPYPIYGRGCAGNLKYLPLLTLFIPRKILKAFLGRRKIISIDNVVSEIVEIVRCRANQKSPLNRFIVDNCEYPTARLIDELKLYKKEILLSYLSKYLFIERAYFKKKWMHNSLGAEKSTAILDWISPGR